MPARSLGFPDNEQLHHLDLFEHHRKLHERIGALEADAAQFDTPVQGALELNQKVNRLRRELVTLLERIVTRVTG